MNDAPKLDATEALAWLQDVADTAHTHGERTDAQRTMRVIETALSDYNRSTAMLPARRRMTLEWEETARKKASGHSFDPSPKLGGRCSVCEGYGQDHKHPFQPDWADRCKVCGYRDEIDYWCHT